MQAQLHNKVVMESDTILFGKDTFHSPVAVHGSDADTNIEKRNPNLDSALLDNEYEHDVVGLKAIQKHNAETCYSNLNMIDSDAYDIIGE